MIRDIGGELAAILAITPTSHLGSTLRNMSFQQAQSLSLLTKKCPESIYLGLMNVSIEDVQEALVKSGLGWKGDAPFRIVVAACRSIGINPNEQTRAQLNAALSRQLETGIINIGLFLVLIQYWKSLPKSENIYGKVDASSTIDSALTRIPSQLYVFDLIQERLFFSRQKVEEIDMLGNCIGTEQFCRLLDAVDVKFPLTDPVFRTVLEESKVLNETGLIVISALKNLINRMRSRRLSLENLQRASTDLTDISDHTDIGRSISYGKIIATLRQAWPRVNERLHSDSAEAEPMITEHMLATAIRLEKVPLAAFDVKIVWRFLCRKLQLSQGEEEQLRLTDIASIISPPHSSVAECEVSSNQIVNVASKTNRYTTLSNTQSACGTSNNRRTGGATGPQVDHVGSCLAWEVAWDDSKRTGTDKAESRRVAATSAAAGVTTISMSQRPTSAPRRKIEPPRADSLSSLSKLLREEGSIDATEGGSSTSCAKILGGRKQAAPAPSSTMENFLQWSGSFDHKKTQEAEATLAGTTLSLRASIKKKLTDSSQVGGDKIRLLAQLPRLRQLKKREVLSRHFLKDPERGSSRSYSDVEACSPEDLVTLFTSIDVPLTIQEATVLYIALLGVGSGATEVGKQGSVRLGEVVSHLAAMLP